MFGIVGIPESRVATVPGSRTPRRGPSHRHGALRRILHVTPYFAPAYRYGGPPRTILGLCQALQDSGVELEVFTTSASGERDRPMPTSGRATFDGVPVRYFPLSFPKRYFGAFGLRDALRQALPKVDLVHVHGLWNVPAWTTVVECVNLGVPFGISTRGMLDPGSLSHHRWRKELCYRAWERRYLRRATFLHATSESEEASLTELALGPEISQIPNGLSLPSASPRAKVMERLGVNGEHPIRNMSTTLRHSRAAFSEPRLTFGDW